MYLKRWLTCQVLIWSPSAAISASKPSLDIVLQKAKDKGLIVFEDTKEHPQDGAVKLTKQGLNTYNLLYTKDTTPAEQSQVNDLNNVDDVIKYEVGMLSIGPDTVIPLPSHMHLVVAHNVTNDTRVVIGVLTSEKNTTHTKLSNTQPISDNNEKAQYLRRLQAPIVITEEQFNLHEDEVRDIVIKNKPVPYKPNGVTEDDLVKMCDIHTEIQTKLALKSTFNSILDDKKALIKAEKAMKNSQKQKEESQKKKAQKHVEEQTDKASINEKHDAESPNEETN